MGRLVLDVSFGGLGRFRVRLGLAWGGFWVGEALLLPCFMGLGEAGLRLGLQRSAGLVLQLGQFVAAFLVGLEGRVSCFI